MPNPRAFGSADELWTQLDAFARGMEPEVAKAFRRAIARARASLTDEELLEIVRTGNVQPLLDKLDFTDFKLALRQSMVDAASHTALPFEVRFDVLNTSAIRALQAAELSVVQGLTAEVVAGVRQYLVAGLKAGVNPVETAREIRTIIGLTSQQAQSVLNYRQLLTGGAKGQPYREVLRRATRDGRFDASVIRAIEEKTPLKPEQVARQLERFEQRLLSRRAQTIARTETMDALYQGQQMRWQEAIDAGEVVESSLRRFWHTAHDERTCPICAQIPILNPEGVAFSQPFELPDGEYLMGPTAHPNCRCVVFVRIVFGKVVVDIRKLAWDLSGLRRAA